mmetsp:Transcript_16175/g.29326  ORF Transcript_16175/g.29326 Transcript_16175/m.29326 type:complete len:160 (-) Transcript_16175:79-558(-)
MPYRDPCTEPTNQIPYCILSQNLMATKDVERLDARRQIVADISAIEYLRGYAMEECRSGCTHAALECLQVSIDRLSELLIMVMRSNEEKEREEDQENASETFRNAFATFSTWKDELEREIPSGIIPRGDGMTASDQLEGWELSSSKPHLAVQRHHPPAR